MGQGVRLRIFARDPDRARAFYAQVFGWSLPEGPWCCWLISSAEDPRLGVDGPARNAADHHSPATIPTVHVADLDATAAAALAAGGEILVARIPLPGAGWLIYLADTEGNLIGIMQDDPGAAWPQTPTSQPPAGSGTRAGTGPGGSKRSTAVIKVATSNRQHREPTGP